MSFGGDGVRANIDIFLQTNPDAVFDLRREVDQLKSALDAMRASNQTTSAAFHGLQSELDATTSLLDQVEAHLKTTADAAAAADRSARGLGEGFALTERQIGAISRGILEFSRGLEDITVAGPLGALNNLPGIVRAIGDAFNLSTPAVNAMTAAFSVLGTAGYAIYRNWEQLEDLFKLGIERPAIAGIAGLKKELEAASKVVEGFEKQTRLSLIEFDEYGKAKDKVAGLNAELQRQKDLQDLLDGKSKAQRERASAFREAFAESGEGAGDPLRDLVNALAAGADARGNVVDPTTGRSATAQAAAENLVRDASQGVKGASGDIVRILRGAYGDRSQFAQNIVNTDPAEVARRKAVAEKIEVDFAEDERFNSEAAKRTAAAEKAAAKATADATRQQNQAQKQAETALERANRDIDARAKRFGAGFQPGIEAALIENRLNGSPMDEGALKALIARQVAAMLPRNERGLAGRIVNQASDEMLKDVTANQAQTSSLMEAMSVTLMQLYGKQQQVQMSNMRTHQNLMGIRAQQGRPRVQQPTRLRLAN